MMRFDIRYSRSMSFWMELQILFKTFPAIAQQIRDHRAKVAGKPDEGKPVAGKENA
jgi:lipopolysaccharide/colanic/teichoic acid biosynthesis glycosyltransferase